MRDGECEHLNDEGAAAGDPIGHFASVLMELEELFCVNLSIKGFRTWKA
jgi:hypothetical protein